MTTDNLDRLVTLKQLGEYYNGALHPKHIAWIWRKILFGLDFAHYEGVIHGGLVPHNILIEPADHLVALSSWQFSTLDHGPHKAISMVDGDWYPKEINHNGNSTFGLDFYVAGKAMLWAGEDAMPDEMKRHFAWVTSTSTLGRPQSARAIIDDFNEVITECFGQRSYFPLSDFYWPIYPEA
jgi:serine/threonine protein kinase